MVWCWRDCSIRWTAACRTLQAGWAAWHTTALAGPREWLDDILLSQQRVSPADLVLVSPLTLYQDGAGRHRAPDSRYLQCRDAISLLAPATSRRTENAKWNIDLIKWNNPAALPSSGVRTNRWISQYWVLPTSRIPLQLISRVKNYSKSISCGALTMIDFW